MQKSIICDGRKIELKTNGLVPLIYQKEFKRDFFADIHSLNLADFDIEILYNLVWVYAKIANEELPPLYEWLESLEGFPIFAYKKTILELTVACITTKGTTSKKKKATESHG